MNFYLPSLRPAGQLQEVVVQPLHRPGRHPLDPHADERSVVHPPLLVGLRKGRAEEELLRVTESDLASSRSKVSGSKVSS